MPHLDDTSRCPLADRCERCGSGEDLAVATAKTPVGVLCLALCGACVEAGEVPPIRSWGVAVERVGEHCAHLHIDVDEMARLMEEDGDD